MEKTAKSLMKSVVYISAEATIVEAARIMKKENIGSVLVGEKAKPLGIFTERDVTRRVLAEGLDAKATRVGEVMSKKLITVDTGASLEEVFACLAKGQFRHLPITEDGEIVGILSLTDLMRVLTKLASDARFLQSFGADAPAA